MTEPMPLPEDERLRQQEARLQLGDFMAAARAGDKEGAAAALAAGIQTMSQVDMATYVDSVHLPEDAGVWADDLRDILHRIPDGWGRWISCGRGWYPLLVRLNQRIRALAPAYAVYRVKEKFGTLRYYWGGTVLEPMPDDPEPPDCPRDASEEERIAHGALQDAWHERFMLWRMTPAGEAWPEQKDAIIARIEALVAEAEAASARTCERCGEAGSPCCTQARSAWYSTRCARCAADDGLITVEAYEQWRESMRPEWERKERLDFLSRIPGRARLIAAADTRLHLKPKQAVCAATPEEAVAALAAGGIEEIWLADDAVGKAVVAWLAERYAGHDSNRPVYQPDGQLAYTVHEAPENSPVICALGAGHVMRPLIDALGFASRHFPGIGIIYGAEVVAALAADEAADAELDADAVDREVSDADAAPSSPGNGLAGSVRQLVDDEMLMRPTGWDDAEDV